MISKKNSIIIKDKHTLEFDDFIFKCSIGKNGFTTKKVEGDKKTPKGFFNIGKLLYRQDREKKPFSKLISRSINSNMGWCNDIYDKKNYNKLINIKDNIKYEKLFRNDYKYDLLIPIMYNTKERMLNKGSAIFIHLTRNYKPTAGCVAINRKDFLILIKLINKNTKIKIF